MRIQPWNLVFLVGFIVYVSIRGVFKQRTKRNEKAVSRADALEKTLMAIVIPGGLLLPVVYLFTPWLRFADYHLPAVAPWCGAVLMVAALWLFYRSHADLGQPCVIMFRFPVAQKHLHLQYLLSGFRTLPVPLKCFYLHFAWENDAL